MRAIIGQLLFLSIILTSCKDNSIAAKIYEKCGEQDKCVRQVKDVTNFKWDKVYIFRVGTSLEDIEKGLGFPYKQWQDVADRIIFVGNGKVVYHEEYYPYPEYIEKGRTFFELSKTPYVGEYNTATFSVRKEENVNGEWYYKIIPTK
jgi:hypothetical protein